MMMKWNSNYSYLNENELEYGYEAFLALLDMNLEGKNSNELQPYYSYEKPKYVHTLNNYYFKIIKMLQCELFGSRYHYRGIDNKQERINHDSEQYDSSIIYLNKRKSPSAYQFMNLSFEKNNYIKTIAFDSQKTCIHILRQEDYYFDFEIYFKLMENKLPIIEKIVARRLCNNKDINQSRERKILEYEIKVEINEDDKTLYLISREQEHLYYNYEKMKITGQKGKILKKGKKKTYDLISFNAMIKDSFVDTHYKHRELCENKINYPEHICEIVND